MCVGNTEVIFRKLPSQLSRLLVYYIVLELRFK